MSQITRFGVSIEKTLLDKYDCLIKNVYNNRSEAIRDLIRDKLIEKEIEEPNTEVVGSLTLLFNHHQQGLTNKMLDIQHDYHHLFLSNLHLHLNHDFCLEIIVVKGPAGDLQDITRKLISLKGVYHGELTVTSTGENLRS